MENKTKIINYFIEDAVRHQMIVASHFAVPVDTAKWLVKIMDKE